MNVSRSFVSRRRCWLGAALIACAVMAPAKAQDVSITAVFKPDPAYPHRNQFQNTTPPSGYCGNYPEQCADNKTFSLQVPIQFDSRAPITANHPSQRQGTMLKAPAEWRSLTVVHKDTGEPKTLRVRIAGIGSLVATDDVMALVGGGRGLPRRTQSPVGLELGECAIALRVQRGRLVHKPDLCVFLENPHGR